MEIIYSDGFDIRDKMDGNTLQACFDRVDKRLRHELMDDFVKHNFDNNIDKDVESIMDQRVITIRRNYKVEGKKGVITYEITRD